MAPATNSDGLRCFVRRVDRVDEHPANCRVVFVEKMSHGSGVTIKAQRKLCEIVRSNGITIEDFEEFICKDHVRGDLTHGIHFEPVFALA